MANNELAHHDAAGAFPMMERARFEELKADIATQGLREAITLYDGATLDGRNRYRACKELGITPQTRNHTGDPWAYVWSLNGQRRDLSEDQRAQIFIHVEQHSDRWQCEREQTAAAANEKRSKAAKEQHAVSNPRAGEKSGGPTKCRGTKTSEVAKAKASAAGVNAGAIARAEALAKKRPDLAEKVRTGEVKPAEARRQAKRDEVADKAACCWNKIQARVI